MVTLAATHSHRAASYVILVCSVVVVLVWLPVSAAAAPPNDDIANALPITGLPAEATGSTVDATHEPGEPNHRGLNGERSIWYRWISPANTGVTMGFFGCAQSFPDSDPIGGAYVAVYIGDFASGLIDVGAGDSGSFRATAGQVYWIAVDMPPGLPSDPNVCLRLVGGPVNDDFAQATPLPGFPVASSMETPSADAIATSEHGEPNHGGDLVTRSVWYSWTAPADGPARLSLCGGDGTLAVYTGERVDALTRVAASRTDTEGCGTLAGASVTVGARQGMVYRIVYSSAGTLSPFQVLVGTQAAVVARGGRVSFLYTAFPGLKDEVRLRLAGQGRKRTLRLEARGVTAAIGCHTSSRPGLLLCPARGNAPPVLDMNLGDQGDRADVRLPARVSPRSESIRRRILGGAGNDALRGSAGSYDVGSGWHGGLRLSGGPGADRLLGESGFDQLEGGPGADSFAGGAGDDSILGGPGPDRIDAGAGRDTIHGGRGDDRMRSLDGFSDLIGCQAGLDRARLEGIDLPRGCERRVLRGRARAVAIRAYLGTTEQFREHYLRIRIGCPIDVLGGCRTRITSRLPRGRTIRFARPRPDLAAGGFHSVTAWSLHERVMDRLARRGVRVTVVTRHRGATLEFTRLLPILDDRFYGE
jgi:RTX calcium-binding nonapeptide repeat (4 copies)